MKLPGPLLADFVSAIPGDFEPRERGRAAMQRSSSKAGSKFYNEADEPCLLVEGFRAISVAGARRSSASAEIAMFSTIRPGNAHRRGLWKRHTLRFRWVALHQAAQFALDKCSRHADGIIWKRRWPTRRACGGAKLASGLRQMASLAGEPPRDLSAKSLRIADTMRPRLRAVGRGIWQNRCSKRPLLATGQHRLQLRRQIPRERYYAHSS